MKAQVARVLKLSVPVFSLVLIAYAAGAATAQAVPWSYWPWQPNMVHTTAGVNIAVVAAVVVGGLLLLTAVVYLASRIQGRSLAVAGQLGEIRPRGDAGAAVDDTSEDSHKAA